MSYLKSLARKDFEKQLQFVLANCRRASIKKRGYDSGCIDMIYQAAIFKASAGLEEYIRSAISDWLHLVEINNSAKENLPKNLKSYVVGNSQMESFRLFFYKKDEKGLIEKISSNTAIKIWESGPISLGTLNYKQIVDGKKYPSVKNIKALFFRIGIKEIFDEMGKKFKKDFKLPLESFLDVREALAHQSPPNVTFDDIKIHFTHLQALVNGLDRILFSHVVKYTKIECWKITI